MCNNLPHTFYSRFHFIKGRRAYHRFRNSRYKRHLEAAIESYRHACEASGAHEKSYSSYLLSYATAVNLYDQTFAQTNRKLIELLEQARAVFEKRNYQPKNYAALLNQLGEGYLNQYRRTKDHDDYRRAIGAFTEARSPDVSSPGSIPFLTSLIGTAVALWTSCHDLQPLFEDFRALREAILHLEAARTYHIDHRSSTIEGECCLHLGSVYGRLYDPDLKNFHYLDKSIESSERAVAFFKPNSSHRATALFNLAKQRFRRYADMKDEADLIEAEENVEKARDLVQRGYRTRDLPQEIEELAGYIASCKQSIDMPFNGSDILEVGLGGDGSRVPCSSSMSRYYLRKS